MTKIYTEELETTLSQEFTLSGNERRQVSAIRPWVLMFNVPAGTFTFSLKSGSDILAQVSFTSADIQSDLSTSDTYGYIYKRLVFDNIIPLEAGTYTIEMSSSGYTFSESSFIGWGRRTENLFYEVSGQLADDSTYPLAFELWEQKRAIYG